MIGWDVGKPTKRPWGSGSLATSGHGELFTRPRVFKEEDYGLIRAGSARPTL